MRGRLLVVRRVQELVRVPPVRWKPAIVMMVKWSGIYGMWLGVPCA